MGTSMTKQNRPALLNAEDTALENDTYHQPKRWDWAYKNGEPPAWPEDGKQKGKSKGKKSAAGRDEAVAG